MTEDSPSYIYSDSSAGSSNSIEKCLGAKPEASGF